MPDRKKGPTFGKPRDPNGFFSRREVCEFLGVSRWTLKEMIESGQFPEGVPRSRCLLGWRIATVYGWKAADMEAGIERSRAGPGADGESGGEGENGRQAKSRTAGRVKKDRARPRQASSPDQTQRSRESKV